MQINPDDMLILRFIDPADGNEHDFTVTRLGGPALPEITVNGIKVVTTMFGVADLVNKFNPDDETPLPILLEEARQSLYDALGECSEQATGED